MGANLEDLLRQQREIAGWVRREVAGLGFKTSLAHQAADLAKIVEVIDQELSAGGTLPDAWARAQHPRFTGPVKP